VNTCVSMQPLRRVFGVLGNPVSSTTRGTTPESLARNLPSLNGLFHWVLIASFLLVTVSGCGRYKEELETAKQQIDKLNSEVKKLTEMTARLSQEESRLRDDAKTLSDKNTLVQRELDTLKKGKTGLDAENKELRKKNSVAEEEIASLKSEKARLTQEVEELKKRVAALTPPSKSPVATPTEVGPQSQKQPEGQRPCDAVVAFMNACEEILKQQKGTERTQSLERVKLQYAPRMKGAPDKAIKAAESWVKEGTKFWDQSSDDAVFRLLQLRNTVMEACGKSPSGVGPK
jgi:hypothetical protein